ncbi:MAG: hypothetical protein ACRDFB_04610, partial [Rhabdochlamydiaceae bacterium]
YMSDKGSRKKILLFTISCIIASMLTMMIGKPLCSKEQFPILLGIASIINGVLGNVFPVAAAAYSQKIDDFQKVLKLSFICRYGAVALPFLLQIPNFYGFLTALILNVVSITMVSLNFSDSTLAKE